MRNSGWWLHGCVVVAAMSVAPATARDTVAPLEKPLKVVHTALPRDKDNPDAKPEVRCSHYANFVVKEIDSGEEDADQLSILPAKEDRTCRKENAPDERIVSANDWTGYFDGAVGNYILFAAGDGWNGGLGFAVFTPGAKKLFEDVAKSWTSVKIVAGQGIELRYARVYGAKCSLDGPGAQTCWKKITELTGLNGAMPDCTALYAKEQRRTPAYAKQILSDPAAVYYDVTTTIGPAGAHIVPLPNSRASCAPQE